MILLLDTSTPICKLTLVNNSQHYTASWEANRDLAKGLLEYLERELRGQGKVFADLTALGVFRGPGSFTGLRIGLTVLNTLADSLAIPIVGETGDDWQGQCLSRLEQSQNDHIVVPLYGSDAHITSPRK